MATSIILNILVTNQIAMTDRRKIVTPSDGISSDLRMLQNIRDLIEVQNRFLTLCDQLGEVVEMFEQPSPPPLKWWQRLFVFKKRSEAISDKNTNR